MNAPPERSSRLVLDARPDAPSDARRHLRYLAADWSWSSDLLDSVELVVSELVANAVQHAHRPVPTVAADVKAAPTVGGLAEDIVLTIRQYDGVLRVEVTDTDATPPRFVASDAESEHGRGLVIVAALAKQWGCLQPLGGGKTVWTELVME